MLKDIGWLWGIIFLANTGLIVLSRLYILMYPVLAIICVYFTYMRYDRYGKVIS